MAGVPWRGVNPPAPLPRRSRGRGRTSDAWRCKGRGTPQGRLKVCPDSSWRGCQHWVRSAGLSAPNAPKPLCHSRSAHTG